MTSGPWPKPGGVPIVIAGPGVPVAVLMGVTVPESSFTT